MSICVFCMPVTIKLVAHYLYRTSLYCHISHVRPEHVVGASLIRPIGILEMLRGLYPSCHVMIKLSPGLLLKKTPSSSLYPIFPVLYQWRIQGLGGGGHPLEITVDSGGFKGGGRKRGNLEIEIRAKSVFKCFT